TYPMDFPHNLRKSGEVKNTKIQDTQIQETQIEEKEKRLVEKEKELNEKNEELKILKERLETNEKTLSERDAVLMETNNKLQHATEQVKEKISQLENMNKLLSEKETQLKNTDKELETSNNKLETLGQELQDEKRQLQEMMIVLEQQKTELAEKNQQLEEKERLLTERETQLMERDKQLEEKDRLLEEKTKQLQEQTDPEPSAPIRRRNSIQLIHPIMGGELSSPHSPLLVPVAELRLVLLGRMGSGKRAAGNTILSREERNQAATSTATSTSTQQSESTQGEVAGRKVTVVDTPDWFSPGLSLEKLRQDVGLCVHLSAPGPHAFLLVIPVKQPTGEERGMLEKMEEIFWERCWRNTMIIFSVTDKLQKKNFNEFIQLGDQEVQRLMDKCGNRFHCLNIKESGDGSQVSELLEKIEKMVEGSCEKFYSSEIYLETESQIRALKTKIKNEREEKMMREEIEEIEAIRKVYEREAMMESERNLIKIILPELQKNMFASKTKMQEDFSRDMELKNRELETIDQKLLELTSYWNMFMRRNRQVTEGRRYEGRVSLFTQELERGNVSLQLRHCTESDAGHYLCQVTDGDRTEEITVEM
ncbi:calponin homology domain-containing protein, partial [Clarias magur]